MYELWCWDVRNSDGSYDLRGLRFGHLLNIGRSLSIVDVCELQCRNLRYEHGVDSMHLMQHGHLLSSGRLRMHRLQHGDIRDSDGSDELHELRCGHVFDLSGGLGIVDVHELFGGRLCSDGIDVMRIMQHGHLLSSGC